MNLLPCPFCGSEAEFERKGDGRQSTIVSCTSCAATLENGESWDHGRGWNKRVRGVEAMSATAWIDAAALQAAREVIAINETWPYARKLAAIQVIVAREMVRTTSALTGNDGSAAS